MATHRTNVPIFYSCSGKCCYCSSTNTVVSVYLTTTHGLRQSPHFCCKSVFPYRLIIIPHSISMKHFWFLASEKKLVHCGFRLLRYFSSDFIGQVALPFRSYIILLWSRTFAFCPLWFFQFMIGSFYIFATCAVSCNNETLFLQLTQPLASTTLKMQ